MGFAACKSKPPPPHPQLLGKKARISTHLSHPPPPWTVAHYTRPKIGSVLDPMTKKRKGKEGKGWKKKDKRKVFRQREKKSCMEWGSPRKACVLPAPPPPPP
eukprot:Sspe_Gene.62964::Locus_35693_Transcript_1_1_Confidence_1.000_Length_387::g.62964::m.62964